MFESLFKTKHIIYECPPRTAYPPHSVIAAGWNSRPGCALIGRVEDGKPLLLNVNNQPHVLIAGSSGSGKSSLMHGIINGLIFSTAALNPRFAFIDIKRVEYSPYNKKSFPLDLYEHPARNINEAKNILQNISDLIENRYKTLERNNQNFFQGQPVYLFIDELADLVIGHKDVLNQIIHIGQIGRAANVHVIAATQVPSRSVIPTLLQVNLPCHIALRVSSPIESRIILGTSGAEKLKNPGDMIIKSVTGCVTYGHADYYSRADVSRLIAAWRTKTEYR